MSFGKLVPGAILAVTLGVGAAAAAPAAPAMPGTAVASDGAVIEQVQYRRYGGWRYRGYGRPAIGLGIGAGIIAGAIIANQAYRPRVGYYYNDYEYDGPYYYPSDYRGDPRRICAQNFRSFEWNTGMYTTYGGQRKLCPYLQ